MANLNNALLPPPGRWYRRTYLLEPVPRPRGGTLRGHGNWASRHRVARTVGSIFQDRITEQRADQYCPQKHLPRKFGVVTKVTEATGGVSGTSLPRRMPPLRRLPPVGCRLLRDRQPRLPCLDLAISDHSTFPESVRIARATTSGTIMSPARFVRCGPGYAQNWARVPRGPVQPCRDHFSIRRTINADG
jgi:hypothetical protein